MSAFSDSLPPSNLNGEARWLGEIENAIGIAADTGASLSARCRALGQAAGHADAFFVEYLASLDREKEADNTATADRIASLLVEARQLFHSSILPPIVAQEGINIRNVALLAPDQQAWLRSAYEKHLFPLLIPLAVDPGRPFPHLRSGGLNLLVVMRSHGRELAADGPVFALAEVPQAVNRWLAVANPAATTASPGGGTDEPAKWFATGPFQPGDYIWSEDVVRAYIDLLFPGMSVDGSYLFRVLYAAVGDSASSAADGARRAPLTAARLDVETEMPEPIRRWLLRHLDAPVYTMGRSGHPMAMADLAGIAERLPAKRQGMGRWLNTFWDSLFGHI